MNLKFSIVLILLDFLLVIANLDLHQQTADWNKDINDSIKENVFGLCQLDYRLLPLTNIISLTHHAHHLEKNKLIIMPFLPSISEWDENTNKPITITKGNPSLLTVLKTKRLKKWVEEKGMKILYALNVLLQ